MPRKNKIILRTGTGTPSASDFAVGEPAFDSGSGTLYIKNAAGQMAQITGGGLGANDAIDGGEFVGEIVASITFLNQPQSTTVNLGQTLNWTSGSNTSRYLLPFGSSALGVQITNNGTVANIASYSNLSVAPDSTTTVANLSLSGANATVSLASNGTRSLLQIWRNVGGLYSVATETLRSDDSGATWSRLTVPRPSTYLVAGPLGFIGDAYNDMSVALQSADGVSWNTRVMPFDPGGGQYVEFSRWRFAVGSSAIVGVCEDLQGRVARSVNGASWQTVVPAGQYSWISSITYGNGKFVAVGTYGTVVVSGGNSSLVSTPSSFVSTDGVTWTRGTMPSACSEVAYINGRFLALRPAESTTDAAVSTDGINWALQTLPAAKSWQTAAYAGGYYGVSAYAGNQSEASLAVGAEPTAGSANLTVSAVASTGATVGYQWQRSVDGGATFTNVTNATSQLLTLANVTLADSGTRYRVLATATGVPSATSSSALLTVN